MLSKFKSEVSDLLISIIFGAVSCTVKSKSVPAMYNKTFALTGSATFLDTLNNSYLLPTAFVEIGR